MENPEEFVEYDDCEPQPIPLDHIIEFVFSIKDHFAFTPYYLYYLNTQKLLHFIDLYNSSISLKITNFYHFNLFLQEFKDEIQACFDSINKFLKKFKYNQINDYKMWCMFCFINSDISCLSYPTYTSTFPV